MTIAHFFLQNYRYFDGKLLAQGFDILKAMEEMSADRCWNVLDAVIIDDLLQDATSQDGFSELRARVNDIYGKMYGDSSRSNDNPNAEYNYSQDPDYDGVVIPGNYNSGPKPGEMILG